MQSRRTVLQLEMLRLLKVARDALRAAAEIAEETDDTTARRKWRVRARVLCGSVTVAASDLVEIDRAEHPELYERGEGLNPFEDFERPGRERPCSSPSPQVLRVFRAG